jgi:hypothetical protein
MTAGPYYLNVFLNGLLEANSSGDGYSISLKWAQAYPQKRSNKIVYNIYMSDGVAPDFPSNFFNVTPSFVSWDGSTSVNIVDLTPGILYHFAVRAGEYDPNFFDFSKLPVAYSGLSVFPASLLAANIGASDLDIPLIDVESFPSSGVVKVGVELINYSSIDIGTNSLVLTSASLQRGYDDTVASIHRTDGYDGIDIWDPTVVFWPIETEEQNTKVFECWNRFDVANYPFVMADGYHQRVKDILTTDFTDSDAANVTFPAYDYSGYHRTDPTLLLGGACVGSYFGGQFGCSDSYNGVGLMIRGLSVDVMANQLQEELLNVIGEPCCLVRRQKTGDTCSCYLPGNEYPENRCNICFGTGFVVGYVQYFNPRRSDGRIMIRFEPSIDSVQSTESGLESTLLPNAWTQNFSSIHNRDFLVRFDDFGNEEFRYEILNVTRNKLLLNNVGQQRFAAQRIRKTDPIYQTEVFRDSSLYPNTIYTTFTQSLGIPNHQHSLVTSEMITSVSQLNEITSINASHSHEIKNGVVVTNLGHTHTILF